MTGLEDRTLLAAFTVNTLLDTVDALPGDGLALDAEGNTSLRAAVMEANALAGADTITLGAGNHQFSLAGSENGENFSVAGDLDVTSQITIAGAGVSQTTIDANLLDRVFEVVGGGALSLSGVTLSGGRATNGGAILNAGELNLTDVKFTGNQASVNGGAIANHALAGSNYVATLIATNAEFVGNSAPSVSPTAGTVGLGGALHVSSGRVTLNSSLFHQNTAGMEGGAITSGGGATLTINNSTFSGNSAAVGGALRLLSGTVTSNDSTYIGNRATTSGGAIRTGGTTLNINRGDFEDNRTTNMTDWNSSLAGGAIAAVSGGTTTIDGTEFRSNASWAGGAIYAFSAGVTVRNSLFENNIARPDSSSGRGGAVYAHTNAVVNVINSTLVGNQSNAGGALFAQGSTARWVNNTLVGNFTTFSDFGASAAVVGGTLWNSIVADNIGYNVRSVTSWGGNVIGFVEEGLGAGFSAQPSDLVGASEATPLNPHLLPLAENGGPTRTMALAAASPARDRGLYISSAPLTDARGVARSGSSLDAGAYEYLNRIPTALVFTGGVTKHDQPLTGQLQGTDLDGDTLTFSAPYGPSMGTMVIQPNGQFTYTPPANIPNGGRVLFDFRVTDGHGGTSVILRSEIQLLPNLAPTATAVQGVGVEDEIFTGQLLATDPDGNSLTFLVGSSYGGTVSTLPNGQFTFTPNDNFVGTDSFWSRAQDQYGAYSPWVLNTIALAPVNDAPVINDQSFNVRENSRLNAWAGQITINDDGPAPYTFELISGNEDNAFRLVGTTIYVNRPELLDFESAQTSFSFVVRLTDGEGLSDTATITMNVVNVPVPWVATNGQIFRIDENAPSGLVLGPVGLITEPEPGQTVGFVIETDAFGGAFAIDPLTGEVSIADGTLIDYERFTYVGYSGDYSFVLWVRTYDVADPSIYAVAGVPFHIRNVNEAPVIPEQAFSVNENAAQGTSVGTVSATNPDRGQTLTYAIIGSTVAGAFAINASTGAISVADSSLLDRETIGGVVLTVAVTDNGSPLLTTSREVTVLLNDVNEAPIVLNQNFEVNENSQNAHVVGVIAATEVDQGQTLTYQLVSSDLPGVFAVDAATGQITVANGSLLNHEAVTSATLVVQVTDTGNPALMSTANISITIANVNEAPVIGDRAFSLAENTGTSTVLESLTGSDVDAGQSLTYSITGSSLAGAFAINPTTGEITVADGSLLNFEAVSMVALAVTVTDSGNPALSSSAVVVVTLTDVNETPTIANQSFTIAENAANSTAVGSVTASDVDAGQSLSYAISDSSLAGAFTINAATGEITVADGSLLNFEAVTSVTLTIAVTDSGNPAKTSSAVITISLSNVNETPAIANQSFSLAENSANGTIVGNVAASDVDAGQTLSYSILSGNSSGAFAINAATGRITVANTAALDYEITPTFNLTVRVTDSGNPALSRTAVVTITLTDVIESITVGLDVVPGDATNTIKLSAKFDVAILSIATFDARQVNVSTIRFGKNGTEDSITRDRRGALVYSYRDVNGDGRLDLVVNITANNTGLVVGDTLTKINGLMNNGRQILGSSSVKVRR